MSRSRDAIWQIALTLQRYGVIAHPTEEMIERACDRLRQLRKGISTRGRVFIVLDAWVPPDRLLGHFNPEIDNCQEAAQVIYYYARATAGEWTPAYVCATAISTDGRRQAIDFDFRGTRFHWEFIIASHSYEETDWVVSFYDRLIEFFQQHLQGEFFYTGDLYEDPEPYPEYYLPHQAVSALNVIAENIEAHFGFDGGDAFVEDL